MKKLRLYAIVIAAVALVIIVLLRNRAQIKAETRTKTVDAYTVSVDSVSRQRVSDNLDIVGTIDANSDVSIVSEAQGKVTKVFAEVGDYRQAGSVLIQIDDELARAAMNTANVNLDKARKDYERYKELYKEKAVTDSQLEGVQLAYESANDQFIVARKQFEDTRVTTPISGVVTSRKVDVGNYVNSRSVVAEVVDISNLKITVNVDEGDVFNLKTGEKVGISTSVYPGTEFSGTIKTIGAKADAAHTYPVEVDFGNDREHPLRAGMFAHVIFTTHLAAGSLVIPRQALVGSVEQPQVYVVKNNIAELRNVVIGSTYNNYLEVLGGLRDGEMIVTNGQNNLQDGSKVNIND